VAQVPKARLTHVADNNLVIAVPGEPTRAPLAIAAHLDKINHWCRDFDDELLPVERLADRLSGQLDDTVGVGVCLSLLLQSQKRSFGPLYVLLSEMEEGVSLREHAHLLRGGGKGLQSGMGARRIAAHLVASGALPAAVVTVDTTPVFGAQPGVAIYAAFWDGRPQQPSEALTAATGEIVQFWQRMDRGAVLSNGTNDYREYGEAFNRVAGAAVPSLALEPAIHPYHCIGEQVHLADIARVERLALALLEGYPRQAAV